MKNIRETEAIALHVKSEDPGIKAHRQEVCERVRDYFVNNFRVPAELRALCFFDDQDAPEVRAYFGGPVTRGVHWPIKGQGLMVWPSYMRNVVAPIDHFSPDALRWPFASVIYLHESTCEEDVGLTITLAHELQHFLQYANERRLWAINTLLMNLPGLPAKDLEAMWDIPIEREARIVAKQVAESLYGGDRVRQHALERMDAHVTDNDVKDWEFFQGVDSSMPYCLTDATKPLVERYKTELKVLLQQPEFKDDPDFSVIDLDSAGCLE
jgi:hypothetical protein